VLPGRTATDGWEVAGLPWQQQPPSIVMPVEDMVDASLVGLDQGEMVTIPGLHNGDEWTRFEAAPRSMLSQFGTSVPAPATGIKREGRHNWREMSCREYNTRSRVLCAVVDRVAKPARGLTNNDHNGDNK
jgi:hypothetical protein